MKILYKFSIPKLVKAEKTEVQEDGSKIVRSIEEEQKINFAIGKPNRHMLDDGEYFYHQKYHEYVKGGILPEVLLRKLYGNEKGIFTEEEKGQYVELYIELGNNLSLERSIENKENVTEEDKLEMERLIVRKKEIHNQISNFENAKQSIFENSAEALARNKVIFWWLLSLLLQEKDGEFVNMFDGKDHAERAIQYDAIAEIIDDEGKDYEFYSKLVERASFLVSVFYINGAVKPEEFANLVANFDSSRNIPSED